MVFDEPSPQSNATRSVIRPVEFRSKDDRPFDTRTMSPDSVRGYGAFWQNRQLNLIGDKATKFVAADARWVVMGRLYSDNSRRTVRRIMLQPTAVIPAARRHLRVPARRLRLLPWTRRRLLRWQLLAPNAMMPTPTGFPARWSRKSDPVWLGMGLGVYGGENGRKRRWPNGDSGTDATCVCETPAPRAAAIPRLIDDAERPLAIASPS